MSGFIEQKKESYRLLRPLSGALALLRILTGL